MARLSLGKTPRSERSQTESPLHEMAHRTLLPSSIERLPSGVLVGARVAKSFQVPIVGRSKKKKRTVAEVPFYGTVVDHCSFTEEEGNEAGKDDGPGPGLYRVRFDDGDHEDLDPDEVGRCFFLYNRMTAEKQERQKKVQAKWWALREVCPSSVGHLQRELTKPELRRLDEERMEYWEEFQGFHEEHGVERPVPIAQNTEALTGAHGDIDATRNEPTRVEEVEIGSKIPQREESLSEFEGNQKWDRLTADEIEGHVEDEREWVIRNNGQVTRSSDKSTMTLLSDKSTQTPNAIIDEDSASVVEIEMENVTETQQQTEEEELVDMSTVRDRTTDGQAPNEIEDIADGRTQNRNGRAISPILGADPPPDNATGAEAVPPEAPRETNGVQASSCEKEQDTEHTESAPSVVAKNQQVSTGEAVAKAVPPEAPRETNEVQASSCEKEQDAEHTESAPSLVAKNQQVSTGEAVAKAVPPEAPRETNEVQDLESGKTKEEKTKEETLRPSKEAGHQEKQKSEPDQVANQPNIAEAEYATESFHNAGASQELSRQRQAVVAGGGAQGETTTPEGKLQEKNQAKKRKGTSQVLEKSRKRQQVPDEVPWWATLPDANEPVKNSLAPNSGARSTRRARLSKRKVIEERNTGAPGNQHGKSFSGMRGFTEKVPVSTGRSLPHKLLDQNREEDKSGRGNVGPSKPQAVITKDCSRCNIIPRSERSTRSCTSKIEIMTPSSERVTRSRSSKIEIMTPSSERITRSSNSKQKIITPSSDRITRSSNSKVEIMTPSSERITRSSNSKQKIITPSSDRITRSSNSKQKITTPSSERITRSSNSKQKIITPSSDRITRSSNSKQKITTPSSERITRSSNSKQKIITPSSDRITRSSNSKQKITTPSSERITRSSNSKQKIITPSSDRITRSSNSKQKITTPSSERITRSSNSKQKIITPSSDRITRSSNSKQKITTPSSERITRSSNSKQKIITPSSDRITRSSNSKQKITTPSSERITRSSNSKQKIITPSSDRSTRSSDSMQKIITPSSERITMSRNPKKYLTAVNLQPTPQGRMSRKVTEARSKCVTPEKCRRSFRKRTKPVKYWKNEKAVHGSALDEMERMTVEPPSDSPTATSPKARSESVQLNTRASLLSLIGTQYDDSNDAGLDDDGDNGNCRPAKRATVEPHHSVPDGFGLFDTVRRLFRP